jgi:hypothetical protein
MTAKIRYDTLEGQRILTEAEEAYEYSLGLLLKHVKENNINPCVFRRTKNPLSMLYSSYLYMIKDIDFGDENAELLYSEGVAGDTAENPDTSLPSCSGNTDNGIL